jgi:chitin synthase
MFHSFPQYLVLMSTYINILMVYAFNNWHDVSWGTKGSDTAEALPSAMIVKDEKGKEAVVEEIEQEQEDIDSKFEKVVWRALAPMSEMAEEKPEKKDVEDSYKSFRTGLVILWLLCNIVLIVVVTTDDFITLGVSVSHSLSLVLYNILTLRSESSRRPHAYVFPCSSLLDSCAVYCTLLRLPLVHWTNRHHVLHCETINWGERFVW